MGAAGEAPKAPERHAVIAGTGRAGTSFLVRFLDACGLETGAADGVWDQRARAGFENRLVASGPLPYVVKDPWLFAYCTQLNLGALEIDALIVPMRDLISAAESRVYQERVKLTENQFFREWFSDQSEVQIVGSTPGGVLYSLDVVDQARILAVGFHKLLHWAATSKLPLYILSFPRMAEDRDYLLEVLWPWLGKHCALQTAREAFVRAVELDAIRVRDHATKAPTVMVVGQGEPDPALLDRAALMGCIRELEEQVIWLKRQVTEVERAMDEQVTTLERTVAESDRARAELVAKNAEEVARYERLLTEIRNTAAWRFRERARRHPSVYRPARMVARMLARDRRRYRPS
jgi:hypothetical protein